MAEPVTEPADEALRGARRLRRLSAAAAALAAAADRQTVLDTACLEASILADVDGAAAVWAAADGSLVEAVIGEGGALGPPSGLLDGSTAAPPGRDDVAAFALPCSASGDRAVLAVVGVRDGSDVALLESLAALVPLAFERAGATDEVLAHRTRLAALLEATPVALLTASASGEVLAANSAAHALFGWVPGGPLTLPPEIDGSVRAVLGASAAGAVTTAEHITGGGWELSVSAGPVDALSGDEVVILTATDVRLERAAQRALAEAQRLEAMGQVAGRIAHDFNNLLTVVLGYAGMLERSVDEAQRPWAEAITRSATQAADLTRRLLDSTRRASGVGSADVGDQVRQLTEVLERVAGRGRRVEIGLPDEPVVVAADPSEIEQAVLNLAINASDAMGPTGHLVIGVDVVDLDDAGAARLAVPPGRYGRLAVTDDGAGMSPQVLARCLEPFFTTKGEGKGSGLGLPSVYTTANERGGAVRVESELGVGTSVRLLLPLAADPGAQGSNL